MFHIVLFEPEIPPNTGNIIRLCRNTGAQLHLIHPLGFELEEKKLRRAGLDYIEWDMIKEYDSFDSFIQQFKPLRLFAASTKGQTQYHQPDYQKGDAFIFGPETRGLPIEIRQHPQIEQVICIPMQENSRSLNLANAVSIILYEAWRQLDFNRS